MTLYLNSTLVQPNLDLEYTTANMCVYYFANWLAGKLFQNPGWTVPIKIIGIRLFLNRSK